MPSTLDNLTEAQRAEVMAEAVAIARAETRSLVTGTVVTSAQHRHAGEAGQVGVSLRQPLSPTATAEDRRRNILTALTEAGLMAEDFTPRAQDGISLPPRRLECLTLMAQGHGYRTGAEAAYLTVSTFKKHLAYAYRDLGVNSAPEAVVAAVSLGIIPREAVTGEAPEAPEVEAPTARPARVRCSHEGCSKRTADPSGLCPDHR